MLSLLNHLKICLNYDEQAIYLGHPSDRLKFCGNRLKQGGSDGFAVQQTREINTDFDPGVI